MRVLVDHQDLPQRASSRCRRRSTGSSSRRSDAVRRSRCWRPSPGSRARACLGAGRRRGGSAACRAARSIDGLAVAHPRALYLPRFGHALSARALRGLACCRDADPAARRSSTWCSGPGPTPTASRRWRWAQLLGVPAVVKLHGSDMDVLAKRPALRRQLRWALPRAGARGRGQPRARRRRRASWASPRDRIDIVTQRRRQRAVPPARSRRRARRAGSRRRRRANGSLYVGRRRGRQGRAGSGAPPSQQVAAAPGRAAGAGRRRHGARRGRGDAAAAGRPRRCSWARGRSPRCRVWMGGLRPPDAAEPPRGDAQRAARGAGLRAARGRHARGRHPRRGPPRRARRAGAGRRRRTRWRRRC